MTVSYPLTLPSEPAFRMTRFGSDDAVGVHTSPFTKQTQAHEHAGKPWTAVFTVPPMNRVQFAAWEAFFRSLRGRRGTFKAGPQYASESRGDNDGTNKVVDSIDSTSTQLTVSGFKNSTTGVMLEGDYIEVNDELKIVVDDADSNGSGVATLDVEPKFRTDPSASDAVIITDPQTIWRLRTNPTNWSVKVVTMQGTTFAAIEDITV